MANINPSPPSFVFGYWRPWQENSNLFDSFLDYSKDITLARYQADVVGTYISQASVDQVKAIGELGTKIGLASAEQIEAINQLGDKFENGCAILSQQIANVNDELTFINRNLVLHHEQQKVTNLLLENIAELLRVPDSEKVRQHNIELGLKFFVNAQKDGDLFQDALDELSKAEELMKQDYFVLHRIGIIYMFSIAHFNPQKALDYFTRAAKYASVESDPKAARLANILYQYGSRTNSDLYNNIDAIASLASDSYEKAAFASYVLGDFNSAVKLQSKAVKYSESGDNYFMLAKYLTRINQIDLCIQNICKSIDKKPILALAVFKDIDLVNEPAVLNAIEEKYEVANNKIIELMNVWSTFQTDISNKFVLELKGSLQLSYDKKANIINLEKVGNINNWATKNLDVDHFNNGEIIPEVKTVQEWGNAIDAKQPAWCYYNNDSSHGAIFGKLYNIYALKDPRGLAPSGWHIPSFSEINAYLEFLGHNFAIDPFLDHKVIWSTRHTLVTGFSGLKGGYFTSENGFQNDFSCLWSPTKTDSENYFYGLLLMEDTEEFSLTQLLIDCGAYVRCLKNVD